MALTKEQAVEIKKQLIAQIEKLPQPKDQIESIKKYVSGLDEKGLEEFLKQNKINFSEKEVESQGKPQECIFCQIAKGKIPSYKIAENKKAIVILEINPLSKGHSIIVPIKHVTIDEISKSALTLAQKIAKKIKKKLKPDDVKIESTSFEDHAIINVIPIYQDSPIKKYKADEKELKFLQNKLEIKRRSKRGEKPKVAKVETKEPTKTLPKVLRRIP